MLLVRKRPAPNLKTRNPDLDGAAIGKTARAKFKVRQKQKLDYWDLKNRIPREQLYILTSGKVKHRESSSIHDDVF